jgi:hypothetical protein
VLSECVRYLSQRAAHLPSVMQNFCHVGSNVQRSVLWCVVCLPPCGHCPISLTASLFIRFSPPLSSS